MPLSEVSNKYLDQPEINLHVFLWCFTQRPQKVLMVSGPADVCQEGQGTGSFLEISDLCFPI